MVAELAENPYRADVPAAERWFVGRTREIGQAVTALRSGRNALKAFMGGRGMGKSSLLRAIEAAAEGIDGLTVVRIDRPASPELVAAKLLRAVGIDEAESLPDALVLGISRNPSRRLVVLLDEIEALLDAPHGRDLLENLRIVYENVPNGLAVFIFGGARLQSLLKSGASPFLRTSKLEVLRGLEPSECARLIREPLELEVDDAVIETVWTHTNGHPLWLQRVMERAVDEARAAGAEVVQHVLPALALVGSDETLFGLWWDNIGESGQRVFETLARTHGGVALDDAARVLGQRPFEQIEVLESTGVARMQDGWLRPRGDLFRQWYRRNFADPIVGGPLLLDATTAGLWLAISSAAEFERRVIEAVARWVRDLLELPAYALRAAPGHTGNALLQEEDYFQISLIHALRQHGWHVEAESLSAGRKNRADIKIRATEPDHRACGEVKRWVGTPEQYKRIVAQALGYAVPTDAFAFTVMIDRLKRPLSTAYFDACMDPALPRPWPVNDVEGSHIPAFVTIHTRNSAPPIRVYHFLVQFPADGSTD